MSNLKRLTLSSVLAALALLLFIVEAQFPAFTSVPGVKLGLANIVTLIAIKLIDKKSAALILLVRIILGSIFNGNIVYFFYSLCGGALCYIAMCLFDLILNDDQTWALSIIGAIAHNIGQISVAALIMKNVRLFWYLPQLLISAVVSGLLTGLCAGIIVKRLGDKIKKE